MLDGKAREIIGVLPDSFRFLDQQAGADPAAPVRSRKTHLGNFSYTGVARLKPGATLDQATADVARLIPVEPHAFPGVPGLQREDVRGREAGAEPAAAERRCDRRRRIGAVGADGHDRHGAADRLRQRREPAAGPRRRAAAGAGGPRRARRQPRPDRVRAAGRERRARPGRRRRRPRPRLRGGPRADRAGAGQPAAARQHRDRSAGPAVHVRRLDRRRPAVRRDPGLQVRRARMSHRRCAAAAATPARAASVIARAARWSSCRWRWRWCCWSARD